MVDYLAAKDDCSIQLRTAPARTAGVGWVGAAGGGGRPAGSDDVPNADTAGRCGSSARLGAAVVSIFAPGLRAPHQFVRTV